MDEATGVMKEPIVKLPTSRYHRPTTAMHGPSKAHGHGSAEAVYVHQDLKVCS